MKYRHTYKLGEQLVPRLLNIKKSTVLAILASAFFVMVLLVWLFFSVMGWFFNQSASLVENGQKDVGTLLQGGMQAINQSGLITPELKQEANRLAGLAENPAALLDKLEPQALAGQLSAAVNKIAGLQLADIPAQDVAGAELVSVARYPGLIRSAFSAQSGTTTAEYVGSADFNAVLDHYAEAFNKAGYQHEIITVEKTSEVHRFYRSIEVGQTEDMIKLSVFAYADNLVKVVMQK